ncbi:MAG: type II toxin-antitoxin system HicB family antitoxin [Microcystis aeruginosa Ma_MB_S_20031200_S102]|uniref:Type II toxin-antitoxin system HicB family antitoxin n=1 Tax=Microcystis aeruginosa Ma_MB_S_20031200_S102 TaxID=2486254 RepID=A0A552ECD8_MICAE|nr:MAG: type II toxin-antitoxin system HicB family antitoxin [Microcystis aeruginosa Ma_MB_S_20031200_S102D]TRU32176.1 MAG: type II toxin-antitoxin system HicB family antitoxin [Microcystis aeruginosa Ma_MB_S_20031200_S102]
MKYRVLIEQDEDGIYVAEVPSLPGCISQGNTRFELLANIQEAIALYLESLEAHNEPIPPPITVIKTTQVRIPALMRSVEEIKLEWS